MSTKTNLSYYYDDVIARSASTGHGIVVAPRTVILAKSRTGAVNPKYKQTIVDGKDATNAFTAYDQSVTVNPGSARVKFVNGGYEYTDTYMGIAHLWNGVTYTLPINVFPVTVSDKARAEATSKVFEDIRDRQMPFQAQVFAGELGETLALLRHPIRGVADLAISLLEKRSVVKSSKAIANLWLEFRFGVIPLVQDIQSIVKLFDDIASKGHSELFRKKGYASSSAVTQTKFAATNGVTYILESATVYESWCYISGGYIADTSERLKGLDAISTDLLNIANLPITAWELIPFSFLVDYFVNIGDIISAGVTSRSTLRYASVSTVMSTTVKHSVVSVLNTRPDLISNISNIRPKNATVKLREVSREAGIMAIPPLTFSLPGSKIRLANIAALATSLLLS